MELRLTSMLVVALAGGAGVCGGADHQSAAATTSTTACSIEADRVSMPASIRESSGIARAADGALWTHNDGAEARLYRVGEGGSVEQVVALDGVAARDIEDIDAGPCPDGSGDCLWIADTGDNNERRPEVALLIVAPPAPDASRATPARFAFRYPAGPRDAEALAVLPSGVALIITKGRNGPVELYRLSLAGGAGAPSALELVAQLAPKPERNRARITGAGASEDGSWIAVRSNETLTLHRTASLLAGDASPALEFDLRPLGERQGEGVDVSNDGAVWLTSEAAGGSPLLARLRCTLPG